MAGRKDRITRQFNNTATAKVNTDHSTGTSTGTSTNTSTNDNFNNNNVTHDTQSYSSTSTGHQMDFSINKSGNEIFNEKGESLGMGTKFRAVPQNNWSLSNIFNFSGGGDERYKIDKAANAAADAFYDEKGATTMPAGTYLNPDGTGKNPAITPKEIAMDATIEESKTTGWNGDLYPGAPPKKNVQDDTYPLAQYRGLVHHTGYGLLDTTNSHLIKKEYLPGITEAKGISSNESMNFMSPGTTPNNSKNIQFQENTKIHSNMVKEWQGGYLTNTFSASDKTGASNWLKIQLGKIDKMEGQDNNKKMFKKDLTSRFDNLYNSRNSPYGENSSTAYRVGGSTGDERKENKRISKENEALRVSQLSGWDYKSVQNPDYPKNKLPTEKSLLDEYSDGTFGKV